MITKIIVLPFSADISEYDMRTQVRYIADSLPKVDEMVVKLIGIRGLNMNRTLDFTIDNTSMDFKPEDIIGDYKDE